MLIQEKHLLADIACIEPVAVHGLLGLINLGDTFLACYYRLCPIRAEHGALVLEKVPVLSVLRPRSSTIPGSNFDRWLNAQPIASEITARLMTAH